jgi:hypothetical protein
MNNQLERLQANYNLWNINRRSILDPGFDPDIDIPPPKDFFEWKSLSTIERQTYWQYQYIYECNRAYEDVKRYLPLYDIEWSRFAQVLITTAHLVGVAETNYQLDPVSVPPSATRAATASRPIPFGELFYVLCHPDAADHKYADFTAGTARHPNTLRITSGYWNNVHLPKSSLTTSFNLLIEAIIFLTRIGYLHARYGKADHLSPGYVSETGDAYGYIVHLVEDLRDQYYYPIQKYSENILFFSTLGKHTTFFNAFYTFIRNSVGWNPEFVTPPANYKYEPDEYHYICPYIQVPSPETIDESDLDSDFDALTLATQE